MKFYISKNGFVGQEMNFGSWKLCIASNGNWGGSNPILILNIAVFNNAALKLHIVRFAVASNGQF